MKNKIILIMMLTCFCGCSKNKEEIPLITIEQLLNNLSEYETKTVDVYGEIIYLLPHSAARICDEKDKNEESCLDILLDVPDYKLHEDDLYYEYDELSRQIGGFQKQLGKAKLMATLRGQVYYHSISQSLEHSFLPLPPPVRTPEDRSWIFLCFALQQVLELEIGEGSGKPDWIRSDDPADWEKASQGNEKTNN